jgi:hypothetical protein
MTFYVGEDEVMFRRVRGLCRIARSCTAYRGIGEEGEDRGKTSSMLIIDEAVRVATDPNSKTEVLFRRERMR